MRHQRFTRKLHRYYRRHTSLFHPEITLDWVTSGWESEIYAYTLTHGKSPYRKSSGRVLRLLTGAGFDTAQKEFRTISLLHRAGYPVPEPYRLGRPRQGCKFPFLIIQRIEGGNFAERFSTITTDNSQPLQQFITLFRQLHLLDWRPYVPDAESVSPANDPYFHFDKKLAEYTQALAKAKLTAFTTVLAWLQERRHQTACKEGSVVHMDFHHNNILEDGLGKLYVIDWTAADISDYRFDIGWTLTLALAYRGMETRQMILRAYKQNMRATVPALDIFEVVGIVRRLATAMISLGNGAEHMGMRPEAADVMREERVPLIRLIHRLQTLTSLPLQDIHDWGEKLAE